MRTASKVAISLPPELHKALEHVRKKTGRSRSALVQEALRLWLQAQQQAARIRQYEAGYRKRPESEAEVRAAEAAAVRLLASQEW
jgi:metal-responsive CopG/Arc/MetJ family transcriptional regulator